MKASSSLLRGAALGIACTASAFGVAFAADAPGAAPSALQPVQVIGRGSFEHKSPTEFFKAEEVFAKFRYLAPNAALVFKVYPRVTYDDLQRLSLYIVSGTARIPIALDDNQRFVIDPSWRNVQSDAEIRSPLPDGHVAWRPDIRSIGVPPGARRLGDLRLECEINASTDLARKAFALSFSSGPPCDREDYLFSNIADRPIFSVTLRDGSRTRTLSYFYLHGSGDPWVTKMFVGSFDWGDLLRDRMYRLPTYDKTWPDDTLVQFDYIDDAWAPPTASEVP